MAQPQINYLYCPRKGQKGVIIMTNVFTSKSARIAAATPFTLMGAGAAFTAEACRVAAEKLGGKHVSKAPGYGYLAAHTTGFGKGAKAAAISALDKKLGFKVSPKVTWNGRRWVASEAWKQEKGEQAFLLSLYKAANKLLDIHDKGANGLLAIPNYKDKEGQSHTLAMWVIRDLESHLRGNNEKTTEENMKKAYGQAVVRTYLQASDLPTYEEVVAVAEKETAVSEQAAEAKMEEQEYECLAQEAAFGEQAEAEARDGRAPKKPAVDMKQAIKEALAQMGYSRVNKKNANAVVKLTAEALSSGALDKATANALVETCVKAGADEEVVKTYFAA